jgi:hypothetical protein
MPKEVLNNLKIVPITTIDEALKECLIIKNNDRVNLKTTKNLLKNKN